ncbi:putative small auxin-up RNA [Helianthus annuus]|nr:putative small auxin-up RNA [Helianthus annuus]KAJ0738089.1 putative small auxin-up RNA [Helianthus annuus]KAJ0740987.1 putative small auxin-up RNA [Helianthus annuus]
MPPPAKTRNKIRQIVRLKHAIQRWRHRCITTASITSTSTTSSDSETETERRRTPSAGTLAVYVGSERHRFVIPTRFLNLPVFLSLLKKAEEEFGFQTTGGLVIPCDVTFFKRLLQVLNRDDNGLSKLDLDDFTAMFADLNIDSTAHCKDVNNVSDFANGFNQLQKARV